MTLLTIPPWCPTITVGMDRVRAELKRVLEQAPGSIRELARAAGIAHVTLIQARRGDFQLGEDRVRAIVKVLRRWSKRCADLADRLETALEENANQEGQDG